MDIKKFVSSILPTMERSSVRSALTDINQEFNRFNKPIFKDASGKFGGLVFKSEWVEATNKKITASTYIKGRGNAISHIDAINKEIESLFGKLGNMLDEYFGEDFSNESITIPRYNIIQMIEVVSFFVRYSRRWLITSLRKEQNILGDAPGGENDGILPVDLKWLEENLDSFLQTVGVLSSKSKKIEEIVEKLPEMTVNAESINYTSETLKQKDIDPIGFGFIRTTLNPIFYIRMARAKYQVNKMKIAELEAEELEFRIIALRSTLDGKPSAKNVQLADSLEEKRLIPLRKQIAEWEEEFLNA